MKVLHILASGELGGIEILARDIAKYSSSENIFCFVWKGGCIADEMLSKGADIRILGIKSNLSADVITAYKQIQEIIRTENVGTVIFHHSAPIMWIYLILISCNSSVRTILYAHNNYDNLIIKESKSSFIRKSILKVAADKADQIIAISNSVKDSLINKGRINAKKIITVYNGIDTKKFIMRDDGEKNKIIYVGRLTYNKGVNVLVEALNLLKDTSYTLDIVGTGPELPNLQEQIRKFGLEDKIRLLGAQNDVPSWLSKANIFVHPAIWEEGFGIAVVEAMSCGLIVVASNTGAMPEIIKDGATGFLCKKGDAIELAKTLRFIGNLSETEQCHMKRLARKDAEQYSIEKMVERLDSIANGKE